MFVWHRGEKHNVNRTFASLYSNFLPTYTPIWYICNKPISADVFAQLFYRSGPKIHWNIKANLSCEVTKNKGAWKFSNEAFKWQSIRCWGCKSVYKLYSHWASLRENPAYWNLSMLKAFLIHHQYILCHKIHIKDCWRLFRGEWGKTISFSLSLLSAGTQTWFQHFLRVITSFTVKRQMSGRTKAMTTGSHTVNSELWFNAP